MGDFFTYAGAPGAYNLALGGGAGVYWQSEGGFSVSTSYLSANGNLSNPNTGAIGTDGAGLYDGNATRGAAALSLSDGQTNSYGLSAWWTPEESGWIPSFSTGWGLTEE